EGADVDVVADAAADAEFGHAVGDAAGEFVGEVGVDVEAVGGGAGFPGVAHLGQHRSVDGGVEVGVVEDDERGVAAEFEGDLQHLLGGLLDECAAHGGGSGEGQLAHARVADHRFAHRAGRGGGDHVEHPVGEAGFDEDVGQRQHGQRGLVGGFDHRGAAGGDGGADLAGAHGHREVPGGDQHGGADGLAHDQEAAAAVGGHRVVAADADGFFGEPPEEFGRVGDFGAGFGEGFAHFHGHQQGEVFVPLGDQFEGAAQDLAAFSRGVLRPLRLGLAGGGDG